MPPKAFKSTVGKLRPAEYSVGTDRLDLGNRTAEEICAANLRE